MRPTAAAIQLDPRGAFAVRKRPAHRSALHHADRMMIDGHASEAKDAANAEFGAVDLGNYDRRHLAPHRSAARIVWKENVPGKFLLNSKFFSNPFALV
jgi:hypothetical protein